MALSLKALIPPLLLLLFLSATFPNEEGARICYLMHQQKSQEAFVHYLSLANHAKEHDHSLLQKAALALLKEGARKGDDEVQLMCLLASSICREPSLYFVHQHALASKNPQLQLASLSVLGQIEDDEADELLFSALASPFYIARLEALFYLAQKGHVAIFDKLQSLYAKSPDLARPLFSQIVSLIDTHQADRFLKQQLLDPDIQVRIAALQEVNKKKLDQFLPQVKRLAEQNQLLQQEAALMALSQLSNQEAIPIFESAKISPHSEISLAALFGLAELGQREAIVAIQERAKNGELFAIQALGKCKDRTATELLYELATTHPSLDVRFNATDALVLLRDLRVFTLVESFLINNCADWGLYPLYSAGRSLQAYRIISSAKQNEQHFPGLQQISSGYRNALLVQLLEIDETRFIQLAQRIITGAHKELIPLTVQLIENIQSPELITFLEKESLFSPSPFVRGYSLLALYRIDPTGHHGKKILDWVKGQKDFPLIQLKEKELRPLSSYSLTYEETSQLFLETLEAIAMQRSFDAIETLIHLIAYGHEKNRYALAGLLIKTAE